MDNVQIPSFVEKRQKQNLIEFEKYKEMARENIKNPIFEEVELKERDRVRREKRQKQIMIQNFKRYTALTILLLAGTFALKKNIDYQNKPINIITHDILANEGLLTTDNGKEEDAKKFGPTEKNELYNYIIDSGLTNKQVIDNIEKYCEKEGIVFDYALDEMRQSYPGLFEPKIEITK